MFEQSLYETGPVATPPKEGDLFHDYEIKSWSLSSRLYKILAISAVGNLFAILIVAQTSLLTMKGCDSPLVGSVCQVLDTVYLASTLLGTERQYVDAEYEITDLGDAEITYVDLSGEEPPLYYPADYFEIANADRIALLNQSVDDLGYPASGIPGISDIPGIPSGIPYTSPGDSLTNTTPIYPKPNKDVIDGDLPTFGGSSGPNYNPTVTKPYVKRPRRPRSGSITVPSANTNTNPTVDPNTVAVNQNSNGNTNTDPAPKVDPTDPVTTVVINREPLKVFGKGVAEQVDKKEVDLAKNFKVTAEAVLNEDGKFDTTIDKKTKQKKSRVLTGEGDPKMVEVVTQAIAAIGDSGWLGYLRNEGIKKIDFTFTQNDEQLFVNITSEELTPERAKTLSSKLNGAIQAATLADSNGLIKLGDDEKALLKAAGVVPNGKLVVVNFILPKPVAQEMIQRNIQRAKESETGKKTNGLLKEVVSNGQTASK